MMILANVRGMLKRDDAQLVLRLIGHDSREAYELAEGTLRDRGLDELLDDPRLLQGLFAQRPGVCASYPLFSYVIVRHALCGVGERDRVLADFVASIVMHFGLRDRANRVGDIDDEEYDTLADLKAASGGPDVRRAFLVQTHAGNYALWLSGMFPDYIEARRVRRGAPPIDYYEEMGRRGYELAASHRLAAEHGLSALLSAAANRFGTLRVALNRVSDMYLFPNVHSPDRLLRQVRDEARWRMVS
jgi:hypothetical protein